MVDTSVKFPQRNADLAIDEVAQKHKDQLALTKLRTEAVRHSDIINSVLDCYADPRVKDAALAVAGDILRKLGEA